MRKSMIILPCVLLAACGGGGGAGAQAVSGAPALGGGGSGDDRVTGEPHSFVAPTKTVTYNAIGSSQNYQFSRRAVDDGAGGLEPSPQLGQLYDSNSIDTGSDALSVTYDRDDAEFLLTFDDDGASVTIDNLYQDPGHRTDFGGASEPQSGTPDLTNRTVFYIESGSSSNLQPAATGPFLLELEPGKDTGSRDETTFFYQKPGTTTDYVTYAGYLRNLYKVNRDPDSGAVTHSWDLDRGALVFGEQTPRDDAPTSGVGSYTGEMIATMIYNDFDAGDTDGSFQWIVGDATLDVDFSNDSFGIGMNGLVRAAESGTDPAVVSNMPAGSVFSATGAGSIDAATGLYLTFSGAFTDAGFTTPGGGGTPARVSDPYLSANTIDGSLFGPNGEEAGGAFRLSSGEPDQRFDILGAFTGAQ